MSLCSGGGAKIACAARRISARLLGPKALVADKNDIDWSALARNPWCRNTWANPIKNLLARSLFIRLSHAYEVQESLDRLAL